MFRMRSAIMPIRDRLCYRFGPSSKWGFAVRTDDCEVSGARKPKAIAKTQVQLCRLQDTFQSSAGSGDTLRTRVSGRRQPRMTSADQLSRPPKRSRTWQETKLSSDMIIGAGNENRTLKVLTGP